MKKTAFFLLPVLICCISCNSAVNKFLGKRTPHENYLEKMEKMPGGQAWIDASKSSLLSPAVVQLPHSHVGHFPEDRPRALGLKFSAKKGQRIVFNLSERDTGNAVVFADLYREAGSGLDHVLAADTGETQFSFDIHETGHYIIRLQPDLNGISKYSFSASIAPSLAFPVSGNKARIGSYWGDSRDAGKRKHEGVDIFAGKLTPVVAAADGYITKVGEGGIGGKVVWMNVAGKDIYLYYAHLDQQLVSEGESIKQGDTLGLVGNTGNARYTPPHLHFGVYGSAGPIDPFPYINQDVAMAGPVKERQLEGYLIFTAASRKSKKDTSSVSNERMTPLAVTAEGYLAETSNGNIILALFKSVKHINEPTPLASGKTMKGVPKG